MTNTDRQAGQWQRIRYTPFLIFLLGGVSGSALNLALSSLLFYYFSLNPYFSFICGTLANEFFHHLYYHVVFVNQEIRMKTAFPLQMFLYLCVALGGAAPLHLFMSIFHIGFFWSVLLSITVLAFINVVFIRISHFSSSELADVHYREMDGNYYQEQTDNTKVSRFRAWYHSSRYGKLTAFVEKYYQPGCRIADLGCGNCLWNIHRLPVTGVDVNERMLAWSKSRHYLTDYLVASDLSRTGLPSRAFDIVVMSEVLEHLLNIPKIPHLRAGLSIIPSTARKINGAQVMALRLPT
ncbi:MAG TPA: class I SAM-dependent methyltransferase [Smithella sp.]|nr:class I SAM-dependent methyltransferase [Smithella sp.]